MDRSKIAEIARGLSQIFETAKQGEASGEVVMLLQAYGIYKDDTVTHWSSDL